jgi:4-amino-4-deoxychorismate lyase
MCLFIETICYENGRFQQLELHNERLNLTRNHFFGLQPNLQLELFLSIPEYLKNKTVKCTVTYRSDIIGIEYNLYKIRPVNSLQMVIGNEIDYAFKYSDRTKLNALYLLRNQCDDILIIKNGLITDTSYANIILRQDYKWYSPKNPLLKGTKLSNYLLEKRVTPALLRPEDLSSFSEARIINAMISIENAPVIPIENIQFSI